MVDLPDSNYVFPPGVFATWSRKLRKVLLIELTCPSEENIEVAQLQKQTRYLQLMDQITSTTNWSPSLFTIEVGARGLSLIHLNEHSSDLAFQGVFSQKFANAYPLLLRDAPLQFIYLPIQLSGIRIAV